MKLIFTGLIALCTVAGTFAGEGKFDPAWVGGQLQTTNLRKQNMIKKTLIGLAALLFALPTFANQPERDYGPTGACEDFYHADPNVIDYGHQRNTNPTYILVYPNEVKALHNRYLSQGYICIGVSSFISSSPFSGAPEKEEALNFARKIEADRVSYSLEVDPIESRTNHWVGFYAKAR